MLLIERQRKSLGPITSDVFQASPSHTVMSALCTRFWVKMPLGLAYVAATTRIFSVRPRPKEGKRKESSGGCRFLSCVTPQVAPVGAASLQGGKSSAHTAYRAAQGICIARARLGPQAGELSTPTQSSTGSEVVEVAQLTATGQGDMPLGAGYRK